MTEKAQKYLKIVSDYLEVNNNDITISTEQLILNAYNAGYSEGKRTVSSHATDALAYKCGKPTNTQKIEWVRVEDRLPETWKYMEEWLVIVEDFGGNRFIGSSRYSDKGWWRHDGAGFSKITHWADAPEWLAPKREEK
jgi:hypothetical protein